MEVKKEGPKKIREVQVCRRADVRILMSNDEMVAMHFWTDRLLFSVSHIPPGGRSNLDPGHKDADEIVYVIKGMLVIEFPNLNRWERLLEGDSILIPQSEPHTVINPGSEEAVSVWSTAPHLGYELSELTGTES